MNLRQVRTKIRSVNNVKKITKAMQMVSAVKMRKAQQAAIEGKPYREALENSIRRVFPRIDPSYSRLLVLAQSPKISKDLFILISSNKGLAGSFHTNLQRYLVKNVNFDTTDFITVGKKGSLFVTRMGGIIMADFSGNNFLIEVSAIFKLAVEAFLEKGYHHVSLGYQRFISTLRSEPVIESIFPIQLPKKLLTEEGRSEYLIEPSPQHIIEPLLLNYLEEKIRGAILHSEAVEHSSRMIAMKNATDNAIDVIYNLTSLGNKLRQEKITSELLDMVTAKESVETN